MSDKSYAPLYAVTDESICLLSEICEQVGIISAKKGKNESNYLSKENQIRRVYSWLSTDNKSLSLEQVADIIEGKHTIATPKEVFVVSNAYEAYNALFSFDPFNIKDILTAHKILMLGLTKEAGFFRTGSARVFSGDRIIRMDTPTDLINKLMSDLIYWARTANTHPLIKICVFFYEFEFIQPFSECNEYMILMWLSLMLYRWKPILASLPVETLIKVREQEYRNALSNINKTADATLFIEFMLELIRDALLKTTPIKQVRAQVTEQVERLIYALGDDTLSSKELLERLGLKHRQTFSNNYLHPALELGLIEMTSPNKPNSSKQKYRVVKSKTDE